ncbi:hypothetical protein HPP92_000460 [Vanilla planifolia]|uniref:Uncharacterized protein n=1 Tax=Vanilla planifolia TaxID=51239 RepID=A0A835SAR4_VANPL|nr:hypothetical protein HPP92_000487 [Vanilla planifolia]KAG0500388.1 hypothetical protein HPP92_000460 [Vanilla planifolia]
MAKKNKKERYTRSPRGKATLESIHHHKKGRKRQEAEMGFSLGNQQCAGDGCLVLLLLLIVQRPSEEHDVRLRSVNRVVNPTPALLYSNRTPLVLPHPRNQVNSARG